MTFAVYFSILIMYDIFAFTRSLKDIIITYSCLLIVGIFIWFGVRLIFWLQIKNRYCPERILNVFALIAIIVFGFSSVLMGVQYFVDGFVASAFIAPIAFISVVRVQSLRAPTK